MIYTDEQFDELEREERVITDEAILFMLFLVASTKSNLEKELRDFYQRYGRDGVVTYSEARKWVSDKDHRKRLSVLLMFITDEFDSLFSKLTPEFRAMLNKVILKEGDFFDVDLEGHEILTRTWGADDLTWLDRLEDDIAIWSIYIANDVKQGLLQRRNIDDVMKQLDKRFKSIEKVLDTLALSESTAIGSMARRLVFKELGIDKYQFFTRADERTCEVCGSMHGLTFPITAYEVGVTASPLHPRCRCWEIPIMD